MINNSKKTFINSTFVEDCELFKQEDEMERIRLEHQVNAQKHNQMFSKNILEQRVNKNLLVMGKNLGK